MDGRISVTVLGGGKVRRRPRSASSCVCRGGRLAGRLRPGVEAVQQASGLGTVKCAAGGGSRRMRRGVEDAVEDEILPGVIVVLRRCCQST